MIPLCQDATRRYLINSAGDTEFVPDKKKRASQKRNSQKRASCSKSPIIKPISGCVRIACSGLMITSLLQVVNRLAAGCELHA